jgi:hypothetical protein
MKSAVCTLDPRHETARTRAWVLQKGGGGITVLESPFRFPCPFLAKAMLAEREKTKPIIVTGTRFSSVLSCGFYYAKTEVFCTWSKYSDVFFAADQDSLIIAMSLR